VNYVLTYFSSFPYHTFALPQYRPNFWAGIDCSGFVQRSINKADASGIPSASSQIPALLSSGSYTQYSAYAVGSFDLVHNSKYSYQMPYNAQNEALSLAAVRKGDLVGYARHVAIVHSDKPACVETQQGSNCEYNIIHAYGDRRYDFSGNGFEEPGEFSRKVVLTRKNIGSNPTGFGRLKLWN
jgi:hypothetical protein